MNVLDLGDRVVGDYGSYIRSFINIADPGISKKVHSATPWPGPPTTMAYPSRFGERHPTP
jgi:hypothetical protein